MSFIHNPVAFCAQCGEVPVVGHSTSKCPVKDDQVDVTNPVVQAIRTFSRIVDSQGRVFLLTNAHNAKRVLRGECEDLKVTAIANATEIPHDADLVSKWIANDDPNGITRRTIFLPIMDEKTEDVIEKCAKPFHHIVNKMPPVLHPVILVHCEAGISRSVSLLIYHLMISSAGAPRSGTLKSFYGILRQIRTARPLATPNSRFRTQLQKVPFQWVQEYKGSVYIAGKWTDKAFIQGIMKELMDQGISITHDWTTFEADPKHAKAHMAEKDVDGVKNADVLIAFMADPEYAYRGTFTEIGVALALDKPVYIVSPFETAKEAEFLENVFAHHPNIVYVKSFDDLNGIRADIKTGPLETSITPKEEKQEQPGLSSPSPTEGDAVVMDHLFCAGHTLVIRSLKIPIRRGDVFRAGTYASVFMVKDLKTHPHDLWEESMTPDNVGLGYVTITNVKDSSFLTQKTRFPKGTKLFKVTL